MVNDYRPCPDEQVSAWSSLLRVMWLCSCCRLVRAQVHHGATDLATVFFCLDQGWGGGRIRNHFPSYAKKESSLLFCLKTKLSHCQSRHSPRALELVDIPWRVPRIHPSHWWRHVDQAGGTRRGRCAGKGTCAPEGEREILGTCTDSPFTEDFRGPGAHSLLGHPLSKYVVAAGIRLPSQRQLSNFLSACSPSSGSVPRNTVPILRVSGKKSCPP